MVTVYVLGAFHLDTQGDLLFRGSEPVALGRRAVALLRALVERPGAVVSKDALIEAAWPGQAVEESNLTVQIAALRRALGAAPGGDRWIETMPRRGYRFVGPVVPQGEKDIIEAPPQADAAPDLAAAQHNDAERRQITAMSCELVGNAGRADGIDLEDWREAVGAFRHCVSETAERHDGLIHRHLGNDVLVLFGYPAAHGQDAEQAVRAGLQLCASVRALRPDADVPMRCQVGIATGMVIVGDGFGGSGDGRHEIIGDLPDLAARLRISAPPDTVAIEPVTRRLVGNLFDYCDIDALETGGTDPIRAWQVVGESIVTSRFEALRGAALSSLIGRDDEIDLLLRRWARTKAGDGQIVLVSGEAGIGKSRLAAQLAAEVAAEPHTRLRYQCSPYHRDSVLHPFVVQLGRAARLAPEDPAETQLDKLEAILAPARIAETAPLFASLLSIPIGGRFPPLALSAAQQRRLTLAALLDQLEALARQKPVLMLFEDAHWADASSLEVLDLTVERVRALPVLVLFTFRPEYEAPWIGLSHVTSIALDRLAPAEVETLAAHVAGRPLPPEVTAQIVAKTDGVPLFVEELTKSVLESGLVREEQDYCVLDGALPAPAIPTTLHTSLMARLDRSAPMRRIAQIGAAIGRHFSYELLNAVSRIPEDQLQTALARLVASELVFQRGAPPDAVYTFKHALIQDAAHCSLLRKARQQLHTRIAAALATHSPELTETQPELFAQHYAEAGLVEESVTYWGKAGHRSAARSAMAEAEAQFQMGLDQLALLPDSAERQRRELELCSALGAALAATKDFAAPETGHVYGRARELWERLGSPSEFLQVPYGQSVFHTYRREFDLALRIAGDLLRLSRQRNDRAGLVLSHNSSGISLLYKGKFALARMHLEEGLALYDPISHRELIHQAGVHPPCVSNGHLGVVLFYLGFPEQALVRSNAAINEARRMVHSPSLAGCLALAARWLWDARDNAALGGCVQQLIAVADEQSFPRYRAVGAIYRGWVNIKNRDVAEGMSLLRSGLAAYRATGAELSPLHFALLVDACEIAGQVDEALALLEESLQVAEKAGEGWVAAELNRRKGELLLQLANAEAAEELYRRALGIAREQEAKLWELRATTSLARLWHEQGRCAQARELLAPIYGWFTEGFGTPDLKEAKALLDELV